MTIHHDYNPSTPAHSFRIIEFTKGETHESMTKHLRKKGLTCQIVDQYFDIQGDWKAFCGRKAEYYYNIGMFHGLAKEGKHGRTLHWHGKSITDSQKEVIRFELAQDIDKSFAITWIQSLLTGLSGEHELS